MAHYHDARIIDAYWTVRYGEHVAAIQVAPGIHLTASRAELRAVIDRLQMVLAAGADFDDHGRRPKFVDFPAGALLA